MRVNHIAADAVIIYQNGAKVLTGFVTNLGAVWFCSLPQTYTR